MNKILKKILLAAIISGVTYAGVAVAINVTVPQSTANGTILCGRANGTYFPTLSPCIGSATNSTGTEGLAQLSDGSGGFETSNNGDMYYNSTTQTLTISHIGALTGQLQLGGPNQAINFLDSDTNGDAVFDLSFLTNPRLFTFPDKPGTFALTGDNISEFNNDSGFIATSTGLTTANFASANISQWTNNSGYLTSTAIGSATGTPGYFHFWGSGGNTISPTSSLFQNTSTKDVSNGTTTDLGSFGSVGNVTFISSAFLNSTTTLPIGSASTSIQISTTTGLLATGYAEINNTEIVRYASFTSAGASSTLNSVTRAMFNTVAAGTNATNTLVAAIGVVIAETPTISPSFITECTTLTQCYEAINSVPTNIGPVVLNVNGIITATAINPFGTTLSLCANANPCTIGKASTIALQTNGNNVFILTGGAATDTIIRPYTSQLIRLQDASNNDRLTVSSTVVTVSTTLAVTQTSTFQAAVLIGTSTNIGELYVATTTPIFYIDPNGSAAFGTTTVSAARLTISQLSDTNAGGIAVMNSSGAASNRIWMDSSGNSRFDAGGSAGGVLALNGAGTGGVAVNATSTLTNRLYVNGSSTIAGSFTANGLIALTSSSSVVTPSIGGAIVSGGCDSATTTIDSSVVSSTAAFITTAQNNPGQTLGGTWAYSQLTSPGLITTYVCSNISVTPNTTAYVVKIIK